MTDLSPPFADARPALGPRAPVAASRRGDATPAAIPRETITPASARRRGVPRPLRRAVGPLLLLALWHLSSTTGALPAEVLAGPSTVIGTAGRLIASGELQDAMAISLQRVLLGVLIGGSLGTGLAILAGLFRLGEDLIDAPMQMFRTVPNVALIPLLIIWFGIGEPTKVALIALGTAFPLYLNVYAGIRSVDQSLIESARTLGLGRPGLIWNVILPGALPSALVGFRYSLGLAWIALVFGEQINATAGLGYLMSTAREFFQTDVIVVCLVVYAILGLAVDFFVRLLERGLLAWRPAFSGA